jgi:serine/threonine-protein phosphatase PGAM5
MTGRVLYLARHGEADVFGTLSAAGRAQSDLLGRRIAHLPVTAVWHSPLARAADCARELARHLPGVPVAEAAELIDHVPYVPTPEETPASWRGFFDGYDESEAAAGQAAAAALVARFGTVAGQGSRQGPPQADGGGRAEASRHEVLITHAYPIAWLLRDALGAPPGSLARPVVGSERRADGHRVRSVRAARRDDGQRSVPPVAGAALDRVRGGVAALIWVDPDAAGSRPSATGCSHGPAGRNGWYIISAWFSATTSSPTSDPSAA